MKPCPNCEGGMLRRHDKQYLKRTDEWKIRLRCAACGHEENHFYQDALPKFKPVHDGRVGRPMLLEMR